MRNRTSREEWARRIAEWRRSGLSVRQFAARLGVNAKTLGYWVWRLSSSTRRVDARADSSGGARFVEVVGAVARPAPKRSPRSPRQESLVQTVEVALRDGLRLRVGWPMDGDAARQLATLVAALEAR